MATAPTSAAMDAVARRGPAALAWEVLRRDSAYAADYRQRAARSAPDVAADLTFTLRWGIHFR